MKPNTTTDGAGQGEFHGRKIRLRGHDRFGPNRNLERV